MSDNDNAPLVCGCGTKGPHPFCWIRGSRGLHSGLRYQELDTLGAPERARKIRESRPEPLGTPHRARFGFGSDARGRDWEPAPIDRTARRTRRQPR